MREQNRRIFRWSLGIAVLLHLAVLFLGPWFRVEPMSGGRTELVEGEPGDWSGTKIDVFFGPPTLVEGDGTLSQEPPDRVLQAARVVRLPLGCPSVGPVGGSPKDGRVRLTVTQSGRVDDVQLDEGTGDRCWDLIMARVAGDLLYRWLPNERFPSPVDLYQPVTLSLTPN